MKTGTKLSITEFRELVALGLFQVAQDINCEIPPTTSLGRHLIKQTAKRGRCVSCYKNLSKLKDRKIAQKLPFIHFYCVACPQKFMCLECFNKFHYSRLHSRFE